jgi:peptidoglycan hydrolase CwlO-like protein
VARWWAGHRARAAFAGVAAAFLLLSIGTARATSVDRLQSKVATAREEADSLRTELREAQAEIGPAEERAAAAGERERKLSALLATGEERAARLAAEVGRTRHRLAVERRRLRRARRVLSERLIAIYEGGAPSTASLILASSDLEELATRTEYLDRIQRSDADLADRVAEVRRSVSRELRRVADLKARVDAYDERLAAARAEIASARAEAEAAAAQLQSVAAERGVSLAALRSKIGSWVADIEAAEAASRAEAEGTVERWLGGPFSIPTYIVMCESGGNYGAVNPSSGAGGAYQILPSTWQLYGGQGAPQDAPKAEQDRIAGEIWADSGSSAWVCG